MNTAIATTLISVLGAGLFGGLYSMFFHFMRATNGKLEGIDNKLGDLSDDIHALDTKFTGAISALDTKLTGEIKDVEVRLTEKFLSCLREYGERLARIETKLSIDPPADTKEPPSGGSAAHVYDW